MARAVGIDFKFTGDSTKAVNAFRQVAAAAKASGGDLGAAGRQMEQALLRAEKQAERTKTSLRGAVSGSAQGRSSQFLEGLADSLGVGDLVDQFGGVEEVLGGMSAKAAVATAGFAAAGAAAVKFGFDASKAYLSMAQSVQTVSSVLGVNAETASNVVGVFKGLKIDLDDANDALVDFSDKIVNNRAELLSYGIVIARNADGTVDMAETVLNVASAYQATADPAQRAALANAAFGESWYRLTPLLETGRVELEKLGELGPPINDSDLALLEQYKQTTGGLSSEFDKFKATVGRPVVFAATARLADLRQGVEATGDLLSGDFSGAWDRIRGKAEPASGSFRRAADAVTALGLAAAVAGPKVNRAGQEIELASARAARASQVFSRLFDSQTTAVNAQVRYADALAGLRSFQTQASSSASKYADAQDAVASASGSAARAAADGARRIADAERDAADDVVRAQERVADARERAARSAQDAADRVADAERALRDAAAVGAGDNPLEQQRRIEEARIELDRARRDQAQDAVDSNKDVSRSERDLVDTQEEGARRVADARREAAEAQADALQRVTDAQSRATEAIDVGSVSVGTMTGKVDDLVTSTFNAAYQTALMGGSQEDVKKKVDEAKRALEEYGPQLGLTAAQVEYYRKQLELIPLLVPTRVRVDFSVGSAVDVARRGLAAAIASTIQPPQFAGGGTFRVPGGGAGLAILHDGEKVLTPDQQQQGVSITVNGYVGSEQQLVELISKAYRQGFR